MSTSTIGPRPPLSRFIAPLLCAGLILPIAFSPGFREADEINHFLIARESLYDWVARVDIWGRPGCSLLYAPVTPFGLLGARLLAAVVTLLVCWGTMRLARLVLPAPEKPTFFDRHRDFFVCLLLLVQPCFLIFSAAVMTEMLLALAWVWAAVCVARQRVLLSSLLIGLGGLARPEGLLAIAAWPVFLVLWQWLVKPEEGGGQRRSVGRLAMATIISVVPIVLWYVAGAWSRNDLHWVAANWPYAVKSLYNTNARMFWTALGAAGSWLWLPAAVAAVCCVAKRDKRAGLLLVLPALCFIALHGVLGSFSLFASAAYARYFICIAPLIAILAVWGCSLAANHRAATLPVVAALGVAMIVMTVAQPWFFRVPAFYIWLAVPVYVGAVLVLRGQWSQLFSLGLLAAIALSIYQPFQSGELPVPMPLDGQFIDVAVDALPRILPPDLWETHVVAFHPYARYRLNIRIQGDTYNRCNDRVFLANAPPSTVVISDDRLCRDEKQPQEADFRSWGYVLDDELQAKMEAIRPPNLNDYDAKLHVLVWIKRPAPSNPATY